jgi:hypothetical protein
MSETPAALETLLGAASSPLRPGSVDEPLRGAVAAANERLGRGLPTAEVAT